MGKFFQASTSLEPAKFRRQPQRAESLFVRGLSPTPVLCTYALAQVPVYNCDSVGVSEPHFQG